MPADGISGAGYASPINTNRVQDVKAAPATISGSLDNQRECLNGLHNSISAFEEAIAQILASSDRPFPGNKIEGVSPGTSQPILDQVLHTTRGIAEATERLNQLRYRLQL